MRDTTNAVHKVLLLNACMGSRMLGTAQRLNYRQAGPNEFQIQSWEFIDVVHLDRNSCTCQKWATIGIPCEAKIHMIFVRIGTHVIHIEGLMVM